MPWTLTFRTLTYLALLAVSSPPEAQAFKQQQCKDPLFQTHWAGKNDIQTLTDFPVVKTNLKLCPAYNEKASCCHQTFESEQQKFFNVWEHALAEKLLRLEAHRQAVENAAIGQGLHQGSHSHNVDYEQYEAVQARYHDILGEGLPGVDRSHCFTTLLTYVAGVMCFSCKPEWFHYTVIEGDSLSEQKVIRVRMATSVCLDLWAMCGPFGKASVALEAAIRDSSVARNASLAAENLDMFKSQQHLCDWMHDQVALHPFRLPSREGHSVPALPKATPGSSVSYGTAPAERERRLQGVEATLDALEDGKASGFSLQWRDPVGISGANRVADLMPQSAVIIAVVVIIASMRAG